MCSPSSNAAADLLTVRSVTKRFGPTLALDDVSVGFRAGEVHALMGENGAGKSTLGKVIAGLHRQDSGTVTIAGRELKPGSIEDAFHAGVRIVHQELAQCPNLSVAENLCLHDIPERGPGLADFRAMRERAAHLLARLEPAIDVERPLGSLSPGHRQIVQIASALDDRAGGGKGGARVIVFDEPTSSLSVAEVERLLAIIRSLAAEGITVIYVSHRMGEIFAVCDRVSVLRDGRHVATSEVRAIDEPTLVEQMIGRRVDILRRPPIERGRSAEGQSAEMPPIRGVPLEVRGLSSPGKLHGISLRVEPGEIVGIGGLVGSGRSELLDAVFGLDPRATGEVFVGGRRLARGDPLAAIGAGMGYVPEDRKLQGLFFQMGVGENISLPLLPRLAGALGVRRPGAEGRYVASRLRDFRVKAASADALPSSLSGGNQQKLLIARWMGEHTTVLLLDEPTRGIDIGTKAEIYRLIHRAADAGLTVLLVSSEMPELLTLSDRILVMCAGRIAGELRGSEMTQGNILWLATGGLRA